MSLITMTFMEVVIIGLAVSSITMSIAKSNIASGLRTLVSKLGHGAEDLIHCPYCLSHWAAFGIVWVQQDFFPLVDFSLTFFAVITIASLASLGITKLFLALDDLDMEAK